MDRMYKSLERAVYTAQNIEGQGQDNIVYELFGDLLVWNKKVWINAMAERTKDGKVSLTLGLISTEDGDYVAVYTSKDKMINQDYATEMPLDEVLANLSNKDYKICKGLALNPTLNNFVPLPKGLLGMLMNVVNSSRISVVMGDITHLAADAIVNAANNTLLGGGGVDGAIHRAAGPELLEECRTLGGCATGEAKITKAYNLFADYVIHTVGPVYHGEKIEEKQLWDCYQNSLQLAWQNDCKTVAFPCISTGAYGYPQAKATEIAVGAVFDWMNNHPDTTIMVYFCCFSQMEYKRYDIALAKKDRSFSFSDVLLNKGAAAYKQGDYAQAIQLYQEAAALGNTTAMSNLGYCCYYGRDIPVDKEKARQYWEAASVWGDVNAIYKLGDMHLNGDIARDEEMAWIYYRRAYMLARKSINPDYYPDICLRMLKYGQNKLSIRDRVSMGQMAVEAFGKRLAQGDKFSQKLQQEAQELLKEAMAEYESLR